MALKGLGAAALVVALGIVVVVVLGGGGKARAATPTGAAAGRQLFVANCSICHGDNAAGGYTMGGATSADLRWAKLGPMYHNHVSVVTGAILDGKDQDGKDLDPVMPRWGGTLTAQQAGQIITYLQTLTTDAPANQPLAAPAGAGPGEMLFFQNCSLCHGADASGGKALGPSATSADLRWPKLGPMYHNDGSLVTRAILSGKDQDGKDLDPAMPRWQDTLSSDQVQQLVAFLGAPGSAASSPAPPAPAPPAPGAAAPPAADVATTSQVNVTLNEWKLLPSPASVHFGTIHFNASNTGAKPHDLVVIKTNLDQASLPMTADGQQADASAAGEVVGTIVSSQLQSGASAAIALDLSPGNYVLICNVAHHYTNGMHAAFTVTQGARAAGLPLTGSRARAGGAGPSWWPIALAAVALVSLAGGVVMRRRA